MCQNYQNIQTESATIARPEKEKSQEFFIHGKSHVDST
jgi:hypothetical protein